VSLYDDAIGLDASGFRSACGGTGGGTGGTFVGLDPCAFWLEVAAADGVGSFSTEVGVLDVVSCRDTVGTGSALDADCAVIGSAVE